MAIRTGFLLDGSVSKFRHVDGLHSLQVPETSHPPIGTTHPSPSQEIVVRFGVETRPQRPPRGRMT